MPGPQDNPPNTMTAAAPVTPSTPGEIPPTVASASGQAKSSLGLILAGVAVLLVLGVIFLVAATLIPWGDNIVGFFLTRVARRLPMVLLVLGGIAFAVIKWKSHPRVSLMTSVALVIFLLDMVVYTAILYWLPSVIEPMRLSASGSRWLYSVVYFVDDIVFAAIIFLLVAAAFTERKKLPRGNTL